MWLGISIGDVRIYPGIVETRSILLVQRPNSGTANHQILRKCNDQLCWYVTMFVFVYAVCLACSWNSADRRVN